MGSDHKYLVFQAPVLVLLHVPALIEITAVCSGKVGGIIDDCRPIGVEVSNFSVEETNSTSYS